MKLILTADVDRFGVTGDIIEVKTGCGRNHLPPCELATVATHGVEEQIEDIRRAQEVCAIHDLDYTREVKQKIDSLDNVSIAVKISENNKLFGSITRGDIINAVRRASDQAIDKRVTVPALSQIKSPGKHTIGIALHPQVTVYVSIQVVAMQARSLESLL